MRNFRLFIIIFTIMIPLIFWTVLADNETNEKRIELNIETIRVSNETEFINAIGSNRIIELNPGTYSLSQFKEIETNHVTWEEVFDGHQLSIYDVENLSIIGLGNEPVKIHTEPTGAFVLSMKNTNQITIKNIEAGHFPKKGYCQGGVLAFENSKNIIIEDSILFGCGAEGLTLYQVENMQFARSIIKECSYGIMTANDSMNLMFSDSSFFNNQQYNLLNFNKCSNISFNKCQFNNNRATSSYGFLNTYESKAILIQDCEINDNTAAFLLSSIEKETVKIENTTFKNNQFYEGGYSNSIINDIFLWQRPDEQLHHTEYNAIDKKNEQRREFYKRLEYISRKVNDPDKIDKPKGRKLFETYWRKAIQDLETFIKQQGVNWETESLLGRFYQVGLQMDIKDAWVNSETHLKKAIKLNPALPRTNHLALGVLYASKHLSFAVQDKDQPKLTIYYKPQQPNFLGAAEKELLQDNTFPGTSYMYLFLIYYFQGKFEAAYKQADRYLEVFPDDELMGKFRGMAKKRIGNKQAPGELNVYIDRDKTRRLFDFYFIQGSASGQSINSDFLIYEKDQYLINLEEFIDKGLEFKLGKTRKEMIENIGTPVKVETQTVENRHVQGLVDTIYELSFDGLYIGIYDTRGKEIILYHKITSPKYKVKYGLNVGVSVDKVREVFGKPQEEQENQLNYIYETGAFEIYVVFRIFENKITTIEWHFPVD